MLWLGLHLPRLPLEAVRPGPAPQGPAAVAADRRIHTADPEAVAAGVYPGQTVSAARALVPELTVHERRPRDEHRLLKRLAAWAGQFTSWVSLEPPDGLLLEIGGSRALFGSPDTIKAQVQSGLEALGHPARLGIAPVPAAAAALARHGGEGQALEQAGLRTALAALPAAALGLDATGQAALQAAGLRRLGDCLGLPRDSLARRLGPDTLHALDRLLGEAPDPRPRFEPPRRFHARMALPGEVTDTDALAFALQRLLKEMEGTLRARDAAVDRLRVRLHHHRPPATDVTLTLGSPSRDPRHLLELIRLRLEQLDLRSPVEAVSLKSNTPRTLTPGTGDLFNPVRHTMEGMHLVDRLRARLGDDAVHGLDAYPDHRPERAWKFCEPRPNTATHDPAEHHHVEAPPRPLWLLPQPMPLSTAQDQPYLNGPLTLLHGPERIEAGWWDGDDIARDYYIAQNNHHLTLWIYRERRHHRRWYLHGLFP